MPWGNYGEFRNENKASGGAISKHIVSFPETFLKKTLKKSNPILSKLSKLLKKTILNSLKKQRFLQKLTLFQEHNQNLTLI